MSIKAVDGFSLLKNIPFKNIDNTPIQGRKTVWELIYSCIELLELDVDIADWIDLYADGMKEDQSPLHQVYIDMDRFYAVVAEPTYRDVLELCLRPFAGQIFQSNGALHLRRAISLYNDKRPMSFYSVGKDFPSGWLVTAGGETLVTSLGKPIITEASRERIESMWEDDINVQGDSTLDIVAPLRMIEVGVKNKMLTNIFDQMDIYNLEKWNNPNEMLSLHSENMFLLSGDSGQLGKVISFQGYDVEQCAYSLKLQFTLKVGNSRYSAFGSGSPTNEMTIPVEYGFKLIGSEKTLWLTNGGQWEDQEKWIKENVQIGFEADKDIEINGFPINGKFVMFIKQTLLAERAGRDYYYERLYIKDLSMEMDTGDDYEESLSYQSISNLANNIEMGIELPIADVPNIPNDKLIYALYFTDVNNVATRMWHTKGGNDYNTLVNHIVTCGLKYRQRPARRISGEMFTGKHIDMNTVVQDDKYLKAGFYVNSIELNCLNDSYDSELVEMPDLLIKELPPEGDDCIRVKILDFQIRKAIRCVNKIILLSTSNRVYSFDVVSGYLTEIFHYKTSEDVDIHPADNAFVIVKTGLVTVVDYRGIVIKQYEEDGYNQVATYMQGYLYIARAYRGHILPMALCRPEYQYNYTSFTYRGPTIATTYFSMNILSLEKSFSSIVINTKEKSYLHDTRINTDLSLTEMADFSEIKSVSDYFICMNAKDNDTEAGDAEFRIYRRDTLVDKTMVKQIIGHMECCDHTLAEVAYSKNGVIDIWQSKINTVYTVKNLEAKGQTTKALFYINGELYIIKNQSIFKLCKT